MSVRFDCVSLDRLAVRTYAEVGEAFGISPQRVQQIERGALRKLRLRLRVILLEECEEGVAWLDRIEREARERERVLARRAENRRRARAGLAVLPELSVDNNSVNCHITV
ncbi:MAG: sigma factor-like helix-turn-helix DNA-binding protein [Limisphaerales bacterium]